MVHLPRGALSSTPPTAAAAERLAPLIEMTFRATWMLATRMCNEMLDDGRGEELKALICGARGLQQELLGAEPE